MVCPGHNSLRLQCSILQRSNNVVLNLGCGFALSPDRSCIGNEDVALVVNGLGWKGDEIARARACFRRDKETARGGLVQGDGDDISDAKPEFVGPAPVFERRRKSWGIAAEHFQNSRRHAHEGIRKALGIPLALPNVCALRPDVGTRVAQPPNATAAPRTIRPARTRNSCTQPTPCLCSINHASR